MVKTSYGLLGKDIGISDKSCGIKIINSQTIINYINNNYIIIPKFQRELDESKILDITNEYKELHKISENYFIKHGFTLSFCKIPNIKELYLIDGQHRLQSIINIINLGYKSPDIIIRIQICNSFSKMERDFQLLNSNTVIPIIYTSFQKKFIQKIIFELKDILLDKYKSTFNKSKNTNSISNRLHIDEFINKFDIDNIEKLYNINNNDFIDSSLLYNILLLFNNKIYEKIKILKNENKIFYFIKEKDLKITENCNFYLSLKNISFDLFDINSLLLKPINYKKKKIPKPLKNIILNKEFGNKNNIGNCFVCNSIINRDDSQIGHIVPEYLGGETKEYNLHAICKCCNSSMQTQNMDVFKDKYFNTSNIINENTNIITNNDNINLNNINKLNDKYSIYTISTDNNINLDNNNININLDNTIINNNINLDNNNNNINIDNNNINLDININNNYNNSDCFIK